MAHGDEVFLGGRTVAEAWRMSGQGMAIARRFDSAARRTENHLGRPQIMAGLTPKTVMWRRLILGGSFAVFGLTTFVSAIGSEGLPQTLRLIVAGCFLMLGALSSARLGVVTAAAEIRSSDWLGSELLISRLSNLLMCWRSQAGYWRRSKSPKDYRPNSQTARRFPCKQRPAAGCTRSDPAPAHLAKTYSASRSYQPSFPARRDRS